MISNFKFRISNSKGGFTLIELTIVIAITAVLAGIILFTVQQYLNKGKDANIAGNLAVLIPAGEAWYNGNGNSYEDFCDPGRNSALKNTVYQMPQNIDSPCWTSDLSATKNPAGVCCYVDSNFYDAWVACAQKFSDDTKAFCVDSRGVRKEITKEQCRDIESEDPLQCPELP